MFGDGDDPADEPKHTVLAYLGDGLELARMEFDALDDEERAAVEQFGAAIVKARRQFVLDDDQRIWTNIYKVLMQDPWHRHAAQIELAWDGINRAQGSLGRFADLEPVLTAYQLSERASAYLRQVVDTYLLEFDAACIALAGATVEHVLRDVLLSTGSFTEGRLRREKPGGLALLENAKREGLITGAYDSAKRVLDERNRVMHKHLWDAKIIRGMALESINHLGAVLVELGEDADRDS